MEEEVQKLDSGTSPITGIIQASKMKQISLDARISEVLYRVAEKNVPRIALKALEYSGHGLLWIPVALACWAVPMEDMEAHKFWALLCLIFIVDIVCIATIKAIFRRKRPLYTDQDDMYIVADVDKYSFPSGHSSRVSEIALIVCSCYSQYTVPVVLWALFTSTSRVALGRHYVGDVFVGCLLGVGLAWFLKSNMIAVEELDAFLTKEKHRMAKVWSDRWW